MKREAKRSSPCSCHSLLFCFIQSSLLLLFIFSSFQFVFITIHKYFIFNRVYIFFFFFFTVFRLLFRSYKTDWQYSVMHWIVTLRSSAQNFCCCSSKQYYWIDERARETWIIFAIGCCWRAFFSLLCTMFSIWLSHYE